MVAEVALDDCKCRMTKKSVNVDMIKIATLPAILLHLELFCLLLTYDQRRSKNGYSVNTRVFVEVDFLVISRKSENC